MARETAARREEAATYRAFLLRLWSPACGGSVRASVTDVDTGETHAFPDLGRLHRWLVAAAHSETLAWEGRPREARRKK